MTSTYGTINYTERFWLIQGEPFVRARLKRVFPRVPQHAAKHICISVTPENTRELAWFIDRYSALAERINTGENNIQRLAREFLARRGEALTPVDTVAALPGAPGEIP